MAEVGLKEDKPNVIQLCDLEESLSRPIITSWYHDGNTTGGKALAEAARRGYLRIVTTLLHAGVNINRELQNGNTVGGNALVEAAGGGSLDIVTTLLDTGVNINRNLNEGNTTGEKALVKAAGGGSLDIVNTLLAKGVNINKEVYHGNTVGGEALANAANRGSLDIVNTLLAKGVNINKELKDGNTTGGKALAKAGWGRSLDIVNTLLHAGVDINRELKDGNTTGGKTLAKAAWDGSLDIVNTLLHAGVDINRELEDGNTTGGKALAKAAWGGSLDIVNTLLHAGVDINREVQDGNTVGGNALTSAARRGSVDIICILLGAGVNINRKIKDGNTIGGFALKEAASYGRVDVVINLISAGVDINKDIEDGNTIGGVALKKAAGNGYLDVVINLISAGVAIKKDLQDGNTVGGYALQEAVVHKRWDVVSTLITAGVDINKKLQDGNTVGGYALEKAVGYKKWDFVSSLITVGVDINKKLQDGNTVGGYALEEAVGYKKWDVVSTLITAGVDINKKLQDGNTVGGYALQEAVRDEKWNVVSNLIIAGVDINKKLKDGNTVGGYALEKAVGYEKWDVVSTLVTAGVDINKKLKDGNTVGGYALEKAVGYEKWDVVSTLVTAGVDINKKLEDGNTIGGFELKKAAGNGKLDVVNTLIVAGVDINKELQHGNTIGVFALKTAAGNGKLDVVNTLISAGVDINKELKDGNTVGRYALEEAVGYGEWDFVSTLITAGIDINKKLQDGNTVGGYALEEAVGYKKWDVVSTLITAGVDINKKMKDGNTIGGLALKQAARYGKLDVASTLIAAGVDINKEGKDGNTMGGFALKEAAVNGKSDVVNFLISAGVDIKKEVKDGNTIGEFALKEAAGSGESKVVNTLISAGVDINKEVKDGNTIGGFALKEGAGNGESDVVNTLISAGVDIKKEMKDGNTIGGLALKQAARYGKLDVASTLIAAGVDINKEVKDGNTIGGLALIGAAIYGSVDVLSTLIDLGVDINKEMKVGNSTGGLALKMAARYGKLNVASTLIAAGVDINKEGEQALNIAIENGYVEIVSGLIKAGMDINKADNCISTCKEKMKMFGRMVFNYREIAVHYKIYEIISQKTKESIIEKMKTDMQGIGNYRVLDAYLRAIEHYKSDLPGDKTGTTLTYAEKEQLTRIFADGTEKDFTVRINFVGFTGAGKTSLMYQMFMKIFSPSDIKSTNLIDISIGYCNIDLNTGQWTRYEGNEEEQLLQRIKAVTTVRTVQQPRKKEEKEEHKNLSPAPDTTKDFNPIRLPVPQKKLSNDLETASLPKQNTSKQVKSGLTEPRPKNVEPKKEKQSDKHLLQRLEKAILKSGRKSDEANANGVDYAGQATYYALHQLFMSERGVNLIVLDGSREFCDLIADEDARHIGIKEGGNTFDFFKYWVNLLRYYLPNRKGKHIITVFTHKDLIQSEEKLEERKGAIKEIIMQLGMRDTICDRIYCINTNDPKDTELQELRQEILEFSRQEEEWGQKMPSIFLLLEDKLMLKKRNGIQVITLEELESLDAESPTKLKSRDDLLLFLKIHHEVGTVMHFAKEGVSEIVILNPQWLIDSLKAIISARRFRNVEYINEWDRLHNKGIVDKSFMYKVWEHKKEDRFFEFKEKLVHLMNKLDLISSPREYNEDGKHASSAYFIVPCMLQNAPGNFVQKFCTNASHTNLPLKFEFEHRFLPSATVYRLLATCVKEYGEMEEKDSIFCNAAAFKVGKNRYLTLEFSASSIIANVITVGLDKGDVGLSQGLREFLNHTLQCIIASQKTTISYTLLVSCGNTENDGHSWISWQSILNMSGLSCDRHKNDPPHHVNCKAILQQWSVEHTKEQIHTEKSSTSDVQPSMKHKPQHFFLGRISRRIPAKDFTELFIALRVDKNAIHDNEVACFGHVQKAMLLLLIDWARRADSSYQQLADALKEKQHYTLNLEEIRHTCCKWREGISKAALHKPLSEATDKETDTIITYVGAKYLELGLELGFIKEDVDAFREDLRCSHDITRHILQRWIGGRSSKATWEVLGDILYEIGCDPTFIKEICQAKYSIQS